MVSGPPIVQESVAVLVWHDESRDCVDKTERFDRSCLVRAVEPVAVNRLVGCGVRGSRYEGSNGSVVLVGGFASSCTLIATDDVRTLDL